MELRRDGARLATEERLAGHRLPRLECVARQLLHARGHVAHTLEPQIRLDAVERAQRERQLAEVRVARALPHAVDRSVDPRRAGAHGGDGRCGGEPEVVVPVEVHRHARPDPLDRFADEIRNRLRRRDAQRVDDDDLLGARLDGRHVDALVEVRLGTRRVDTEERRVDVVLRCEAHGTRDAPEHLLPVDADRVQLQVGDRRLDHRRGHTELDERLEIRGNRTREAPDLRAEPGAGDQLHRVPVVLRHAREAGLDAVDAELVEQLRDLELLLGIEHDADGLLAVAQRGVVQADAPAEAIAVVQSAGPDLAHVPTLNIARSRPGSRRASRARPP